MFHNKTIFIKSFNNLYRILKSNGKDEIQKCMKSKKININQYTYENYGIMHYNINKINILRIWNTNILFNYWYTDFISSTQEDHMASIDYRIENDAIIIDFLCINDVKIKKAMIKYIETVAKEHNKQKIIF